MALNYYKILPDYWTGMYSCKRQDSNNVKLVMLCIVFADSSSEQYTDQTGIDLDQFIAETLNRNAKDRALMLRIEQELVNLAKDKL